jgi:hypothetical protein
VSLPRPAVHAVVVAAILAGVWVGSNVYRFFAGG